MLFIKHKLMRILCVMAAVMMIVSSCGSDTVDEPEAPDAAASLVLHIRSVEQRAPSGETESDGFDRLRIIIINDQGIIEVNRPVSFYNGSATEYYAIYPIAPRQGKYIYVIANPDQAGLDFTPYPEGSNADIRSYLESYSFTPAFSGEPKLVMTDSRFIDAKDLLPGSRATVNLNLVRVATKFSVYITNLRDEDITLRSFSVSSMADRQFLMPHFTGSKGSHPDNGEHIVAASGLMGFDFEGVGTDMHWSDWLREAVDESNIDINDVTVADRRGWIMKYSVPDGTAHSARAFSLGAAPVIAGGATYELPVHYFCESRYGVLDNSTFGGGAARGYEQAYTFDISFSSREGGDKSFTGYRLPNLRALFRNTHVIVNIKAHQEKLTCEVQVVPYVQIDLRPGFGWDKLPDTDEKPDPDLDKN